MGCGRAGLDIKFPIDEFVSGDKALNAVRELVREERELPETHLVSFEPV
jgi:hypothetical protein